MKRSKAVTLFTIGLGSIALAACDKPADCNSANKDTPTCQQSTSAAHGGGGYVYSGRPISGESAVASTATASGAASSSEAATARGGFGAIGEAATSGGHGGGEGGGGHGGGGGE